MQKVLLCILTAILTSCCTTDDYIEYKEDVNIQMDLDLLLNR